MKLVDLDRLKWPDIAIFDMNLHGECVPMVRLSDLQTLPPLEDVVPVVRCMNCVYCYFASNRVPSERTYVCSEHGRDVHPGFFCGSGRARR